jgi:hypothetical protein
MCSDSPRISAHQASLRLQTTVRTCGRACAFAVDALLKLGRHSGAADMNAESCIVSCSIYIKLHSWCAPIHVDPGTI